MKPALLFCALLVGCAPAPSSDTTTPSTVPTTVVTTTTTTLAPAEASVAFADCLAENGVSVPPVTFNSAGDPRLDELAEALDTTDPEVRAAVVECAEILTVSQVLDLSDEPEVRLLVEEQLAAFARCMRDEGVDAFPEPATDPSATGPFPTEAIPFDAPNFEEALGTCQALLGSYGLGG